MIELKELTKYLNKLLNIYEYKDYGPNGLQIEGKNEIKKIAFAVSATQYSVQQAVALGADSLIVHHGLFWKFHGPKTLTGSFYKRVAPLVQNDISLLGYHLPLDGNMNIGNAKAIADRLSMVDLKPFGDHKGATTGVKGKFNPPLNANDLQSKLKDVLDHDIIVSTYDETKLITSMGIITGGANSEWREAKSQGLDAYLTGEISEHDWHESKEDEIHYFAGGHNATEQFGVQELMKNIHKQFSNKELELFFIPSSNPA